MTRIMKRRNFIGIMGAGAAAMAMPSGKSILSAAEKKWNILWITCEDISPDLGCYGSPEVGTPNLDRFANQGVRYTNAYGVYGVCAPNRSCLITGMYPMSIGAMHMRTGNLGYEAVPPPDVRCFSEYFRAAGYFCTNHTKTDYQFNCPITAWDRRKGDWRDPARKPDQPFFSVINLTITHESRIRTPLDKKPIHDPSKVTLSPYHPDTPVVRKDYARYYDNITTMDEQVGEILARLEEDGLTDDTIVWFYSDHGAGLPRCKRWCYDSSIHVPLIIRLPGVIKPGTVCDDLVSFVDFAPTVLSQAGIQVPSHIQGKPFLGEQAGEPRQYIYTARDRMDEAYDTVRGVRDKRYKYLRNFQPEKPYAQYIHYMDKMPTMQEWRRLNAERKLEGPEKLFFSPSKPVEELYDTANDPHEINNLAEFPDHRHILIRMRRAMEEWIDEVGDLGFIPEEEIKERMQPGGIQPETAPPVISSKGGQSNGTMVITMKCPTEGASIAYTTEEGENAHWKLYGKEIKLNKSAVIRARAIRIGYKESREIQETFEIR